MADRDQDEDDAPKDTKGVEEETVESDEESPTEEGDTSGKDEDESEDDESDDNEESDEDEDEDEDAYAAADAPSEARTDKPTTVLLALAALALGGAAGWFGHGIQVKNAHAKADAAVQGTGEEAKGPCKDWETKLCAELGDQSHGCKQAQSVSAVLPGSSCQVALTAIGSTVAKIKETRASCETIMNKLCSEIGTETKACELVKTQTPTFPPEKCDQMMESYPQILAQLQQMEQRGGPPGAGRPPGPGGRPPGGGPPMRPPGASPHSPGVPPSTMKPVPTSPGAAKPSGAAPAKAPTAPAKAPAAPAKAPAAPAKAPTAPAKAP
jgi:hypothetical protein